MDLCSAMQFDWNNYQVIMVVCSAMQFDWNNYQVIMVVEFCFQRLQDMGRPG